MEHYLLKTNRHLDHGIKPFGCGIHATEHVSSSWKVTLVGFSLSASPLTVFSCSAHRRMTPFAYGTVPTENVSESFMWVQGQNQNRMSWYRVKIKAQGFWTRSRSISRPLQYSQYQVQSQDYGSKWRVNFISICLNQIAWFGARSKTRIKVTIQGPAQRTKLMH